MKRFDGRTTFYEVRVTLAASSPPRPQDCPAPTTTARTGSASLAAPPTNKEPQPEVCLARRSPPPDAVPKRLYKRLRPLRFHTSKIAKPRTLQRNPSVICTGVQRNIIAFAGAQTSQPHSLDHQYQLTPRYRITARALVQVRKREDTALKALVIDHEASAFPVKQLQPCAVRTVEDEYLTALRIATHTPTNLAAQRIEAFAHIRKSTALVINLRIPQREPP